MRDWGLQKSYNLWLEAPLDIWVIVIGHYQGYYQCCAGLVTSKHSADHAISMVLTKYVAM